MENKFNQKNNKKPRPLTIAENWKKKEIQHVLELRDEMIENNIDEKLIKKYIDEQYDKINKEYEIKIEKYYEKEKIKQNKLVEKDIKLKRNKAVDFLLKNKAILEEKGYKPEFIKKYVDKQYDEINQFYSLSNFVNMDSSLPLGVKYEFMVKPQIDSLKKHNDLEDKFSNINLDLIDFID